MHRAQNTPSNVTLAAVSILCSLSFIRQKLAEKPKKLFDELSNEHTFGGRGKNCENSYLKVFFPNFFWKLYGTKKI